MKNKAKEILRLIFTFDKNPTFHLPWHILSAGEMDINLSILALPAIIWMFILGIDKFLIALVLLSACSLRIRYNPRPSKLF